MDKKKVEDAYREITDRLARVGFSWLDVPEMPLEEILISGNQDQIYKILREIVLAIESLPTHKAATITVLKVCEIFEMYDIKLVPLK